MKAKMWKSEFGGRKATKGNFHLSFSIRRITGSYFMEGFLSLGLIDGEISSRDLCWELGRPEILCQIRKIPRQASPRVNIPQNIDSILHIKIQRRIILLDSYFFHSFSARVSPCESFFLLGEVTHHPSRLWHGWGKKLMLKKWGWFTYDDFFYIFHAWNFYVLFIRLFYQASGMVKNGWKRRTERQNKININTRFKNPNVAHFIFGGNRYVNLFLRAGRASKELWGNDSNFHFNK